MVDTGVLEAPAVRREGSSPFPSTSLRPVAAGLRLAGQRSGCGSTKWKGRLPSAKRDIGRLRGLTEDRASGPEMWRLKGDPA